MLVVTLLAATFAFAQEQRPLGADEFTIHRGNSVVTVTEVGLPKGIGIDPRYRICPVTVGWSAGAWHAQVQEACHPNLKAEAQEAAERWKLDIVEAPGRDRELFEVWFVFPERRNGEVRLLVRQAWDARIRLVPEWIIPLDFGVKAQVFPKYPDEALVIDTTYTQCDARVEISTTGLPHDVVVSRCDEVFHAAAEEALRRWRFKGPELDGIPFWTGVTLGVSFARDYEAEEGEPKGKATVQLPPDLDLGERTIDRLEEAPEEWEPPPRPTWAPMFVVDHRSYAEVGVYDIRWPQPNETEDEHVCDLLFQVNSKRRVWIWPEACDEEVEGAAVVAAQQWKLMHGEVEQGEVFARFRGTMVFPANGLHPRLRVSRADLQTPLRQLPDHVETYLEAKPYRRVPPKLPNAFATEVLDDEVICEFDVRVDRGGRPSEIDARTCPDAYLPYAEKAVKKWRWAAAEADGKTVESSTVVRIRFDQAQ